MKPDQRLRRPHIVPAVFFFVISGLVLYQSFTSLVAQGAASGTPITNAALYPRILAVILIALTILQIIGEVTGKSAQPELMRPPAATRVQIAGAAVTYVLYLLALPVAGYYVSTPILMAVLLVILGQRRPVPVVLFSLSVSLICACIFQGVFHVGLPRGLLGLTPDF